MKGAMKMINLTIGFVTGMLTVIILSCCIVSGEESRREDQDEYNRTDN
jgi:hypothetical protein